MCENQRTLSSLSKEPTPGQKWYRDYYLQSAHWKETSAYFKKLRGFKCEKCGDRSNNLEVHHNGRGNGYKDEAGQTLLWRERERPDLMQVLCRYCHYEEHPHPLLLSEEDIFSKLWITPEEERVEEQAVRLWERKHAFGENSIDEAWKIVEWENMYDLGLNPYDPDFSELAAEGLEGNEDGNYDDERANRPGDRDPEYWDQDEEDE
jgi:hypothetical protein